MLSRGKQAAAVTGLLIIATGAGLWWLGLPGPDVSITSARLEGVREGLRPGAIEISQADFSEIMDREYYTRAEIFSCGEEGDFYPADLAYRGVALDSFNERSVLGDSATGTVMLEFSLPERIAAAYSDPCIRLSGGQMMGLQRFASDVARLQVTPAR